ncbi:ATP-binding cassette domain-containing protein, partial [Frankia sp. AgKG'84/4]
MTATHPAIEVAGLTKSYGEHAVLAGVDLTVPAGTVYALLGPNGAGKTTFVNILSTLLTPDDGEIRVAGFDVRREPAGVRAAIGVTGQFSAIDELLTGRENLRLMADLAHLDRSRATTAVTVMLERF